MSYTGAPTNVRSLEQRIRNLEGSDGLALRRRIGMALVIVGQMLPEGAVKGGSAMALRFGRGTRFTQDLDAARVQPLAAFRRDFEESLATGWAGFTGRLVERPAPRPSAVPTAYVMRPFEVKLDYRGRPWCTLKFELGTIKPEAPVMFVFEYSPPRSTARDAIHFRRIIAAHEAEASR